MSIFYFLAVFFTAFVGTLLLLLACFQPVKGGGQDGAKPTAGLVYCVLTAYASSCACTIQTKWGSTCKNCSL